MSQAENGLRFGITEPGHLADEKTALIGYLQRQRDLVAWKLADADDGALRTAATPSGLTVHGLVRHLENVERDWIRRVFADQPGLEFDWTDEDPDAEFKPPPDASMTGLLASYAAEQKRCDEVVAAASLADVSVHQAFNLRWILLHLVEEVGRHLGHIDLLREQADGSVGEDPAP